MMQLACHFPLLLVLVQIAVYAQETAKLEVNPCIGMKTCGDCIQAGGDCGWCTQEEEFTLKNKDRCNLISNLLREGCDFDNIQRPDHEATYDKDVPVRNSDSRKEAIQLQPQEITVKIRPNKPYKFDLLFRQAENYPVDLYYVMDLSNSMGDDKDKLATLGTLLAKEMSDITKNFRLGFGSFVDKKTMPYVSTVPRKLIEPCSGCAAPYGFHNQLALTEDTDQFSAKVLKAPISGNLDSPEGGFDAIMQAVACEKEIGWRSNSRRLLIFSTDAGFHYAGDGKLGGIVKPNDGHCHLDSKGVYTESLEQDYPSISQLATKIAEKNVNVIFAVSKSQMPVYESLQTFFENAKSGILANDSSNIVTLVRDNYKKISSKIELKAESSEGVKVQFRSKCFGNETRDVKKCENITIGSNVTFEVSVTVDKCSAIESENKKSFVISPLGLAEDLKINLELICSCDCEKPTLQDLNSKRCNNSGTFQCGACTCNPGFYGRLCECDGSNLNTNDFDAACRETNTSDVCDGRGNCICGRCECNSISTTKPEHRYSGAFCQCDDYSCDYFENEICGGESRGKCKCGQCICNPGFTGPSCGCPESKEPCRASNGLICNGKGECICGKCNCNADTYYRGATCEDCPTCPGRCDQSKACVQCRAFQTGPLTEEDCKANCTNIEMVNSVQETPDRKLCQFRDEDDCIFYFTYEYNSDRVHAQRTKECPEPVNVLAIVLGVIAGIVAVGLALLLIWKLLTTIHDRREFAKFEKERQNARWDTGENPIYKQATSTFKNPMYGGQQ